MADDDAHAESGAAFEGISSLIRLAGFNLPERARFAGGAIITSSLSALTVGFVCGQVGGTVFLNSVGPLVPFLLGSWVGFSFGLMNYWISARNAAIKCAVRFPAVLAHSLQVDWDMIIPKDVVDNSIQSTKQQGIISTNNTTTVTNINYKDDGDYNDLRDDDDDDDKTKHASQREVSTTTTTTTLDQWLVQGGLSRITMAILASQGCQSAAAEVIQTERQWLLEQQQERRKQILRLEEEED